jgi:hypothetical protein
MEQYVKKTYCGRSPSIFDCCIVGESGKVYVSTAVYQRKGLPIHNG